MRLNHIKALVTAVILSATIVAFQNCSSTNFTQDKSMGSFKLGEEATGLDSGIDPVVNVEEEPPVVVATPTPIQNVADDKKSNDKKNEPSDKNRDVASVDSEELVECELLSANTKVVLIQENFQAARSNSQSSRVCMSEHACLKLVNDYAAARDCKMSAGAATSNSQTQCAKIFPGSKGTCKNAAIITDAQVVELLAKMAK